MWSSLRKKFILSRGKMRRQKAMLHFPRDCAAVSRLLEEGDYEKELAGEILRCLAGDPEIAYLDVGAYVGLLSLPVLRYRNAKVYSVEGSEKACRLLEKTRDHSPFGKRWIIQQAFVSAREGGALFHQHEGKDAVYSGLKPTGRGDTAARTLQIKTSTLDSLWSAWGCPLIRVIKIDLEGAELAALEGAFNLLQALRPVLFLEWEKQNIGAHSRNESDLLEWATGSEYEVFRVPDDVPVTTAAGLKIAMEKTESFRLQPVCRFGQT